MTPSTRRMKVLRAPGTDNKPMIRISNNFLVNAGFSIGTKVEVSYCRGIIVITRINNKNHEYNL